MKVLLVGASGLIGSAVAAALAREGHVILGVARQSRPGGPVAQWLKLDVASARRPEDWSCHLKDIDAVINCAGVLQDNARENTHGVHSSGAGALFEACERGGVRRIIHLSAIGVDRAQPSSFSATKYLGDQQLITKDLDWVILRPSVVLGRPAYGASALIRGLASLPLLPLMPGTQPLQIVQLSDLVATILFFLGRESPSHLALEIVGPERLTMGEIIAKYRVWYGWDLPRSFVIPSTVAKCLYAIGDMAGLLGWRPPVRSNAAREIARGAIGDPEPWISITGIRPLSLDEALAREPATVQEKWFARLYLLKAIIFPVLAAFWLVTGVISLTLGYAAGVDLMRSTGAGVLSGPAVIAGALADSIIGLCIAWRPLTRPGLYAALGLSVFYAIAGTLLHPDLWIEPLGPLLKIIPILMLHLVALAILEER
ncbi:SDR family oxidoreductase [Bradyrhizobium sp. STM 3557]|uniref:SDR family oxidoreductase n=1 Tax=Bradyrhizobium sp. STM 3557 TaxID=578920 RepID=UPI00388E2E54